MDDKINILSLLSEFNLNSYVCDVNTMRSHTGDDPLLLVVVVSFEFMEH